MTIALDGGDVSVAAAAEIATLPAEEQKQIVDEGTAAVKRAASMIRRKHRRANSTKGKRELDIDAESPAVAVEPSMPDPQDLLRQIRHVEEHRDAMPRLAAMASNWSHQNRVRFCDGLEGLARRLVDLAGEIRRIPLMATNEQPVAEKEAGCGGHPTSQPTTDAAAA